LDIEIIYGKFGSGLASMLSLYINMQVSLSAATR
jgi:hypothetical protein